MRGSSHILTIIGTLGDLDVSICAQPTPLAKDTRSRDGSFAITIAITIASLIARSGALSMQLCSVPLQHATIQVVPIISLMKCIIAVSNIAEIIFTLM